MMLKPQKRLSAKMFKCSPKKIHFDTERLDEIKEAITSADIKGLIGKGIITRSPSVGVSKSRARKKLGQRRKGRQQGPGSRKGLASSRLPRKRAWINRVRLQRSFIDLLREKGAIEHDNFKSLYLKIKGGFFRSKRHLTIYMEEHQMLKKAEISRLRPEPKENKKSEN